MANLHTDDHHHHHEYKDGHGHSHGKIDPSILRSKEGVKAVSFSLVVLFLTAGLQVVVYLSGHSVALLSDLIHNFGDALTAVPLGLAFIFKSKRGEHYAGYFVVLTILVSACLALYEVVQRFIHPQHLTHLWPIVIAGLIGFLGNELAGIIRTMTGKELDSPALIADGKHARIDGLVSLGVVVSTIFVALGLQTADPVVGLFITVIILRITWQSWQTIKGSHH